MTKYLSSFLKNKKNKKGFTILEYLIASLIAATMMMVAIMFIISYLRAFDGLVKDSGSFPLCNAVTTSIYKNLNDTESIIIKDEYIYLYDNDKKEYFSIAPLKKEGSTDVNTFVLKESFNGGETPNLIYGGYLTGVISDNLIELMKQQNFVPITRFYIREDDTTCMFVCVYIVEKDFYESLFKDYSNLNKFNLVGKTDIRDYMNSSIVAKNKNGESSPMNIYGYSLIEYMNRQYQDDLFLCGPKQDFEPNYKYYWLFNHLRLNIHSYDVFTVNMLNKSNILK